MLIEDKYFRYAFENSMDAVMLTKPNGSIIRANKAACIMFDRTEEELCQIGRMGVVDVNDPRLNQAIIDREINGEIKTELNLVRKNGEVFPVIISSKVFLDEFNEPWSVMIVRDITVEKNNQALIEKLHDETMYLVNHDYLTGTLNRRGFMLELEKQIIRSLREEKSIGIALVDLDHFKRVNDIYGHIEGDLILNHIVTKFKECLRPYDVIGRFGGDEFIFCLPNIENENAEIIGDRLRSYIARNPYQKSDESIPLTISVGIKVMSFKSDDTVNINLIVKSVDNLLYKAKQKRDSVCTS